MKFSFKFYDSATEFESDYDARVILYKPSESFTKYEKDTKVAQYKDMLISPEKEQNKKLKFDSYEVLTDDMTFIERRN